MGYFDQNTPMYGVQGATYCVPIFGKFYNLVFDGQPLPDFPLPVAMPIWKPWKGHYSTIMPVAGEHLALAEQERQGQADAHGDQDDQALADADKTTKPPSPTAHADSDEVLAPRAHRRTARLTAPAADRGARRRPGDAPSGTIRRHLGAR